jgi:dTDP-4-dehydrorhamnose 3,5-epimerase
VRIDATELPGVYVVDVEPIEDERGLFARTFCAEEFATAGLDPGVAQCSVSVNRAAGTLRGMHFQQAPHGEAKLVRCSRGRIFDVAVDVRRDSPTFARWQAWDLDATSYRGLFLPPGIAHGFLTLAPESEVSYQMSVPYRADAAVGFRWDDPGVGIVWPARPEVISARDLDLPTLADVRYGVAS